MEATAVTEKKATLAFGAQYADNSYMPDYTWVPADTNASGSFTWSWILRPDVPKGNAHVLVVAGKSGTAGAKRTLDFVIRSSC